MTFLERFWARVDTSGERWVWTGARTVGGYGHVCTRWIGEREERESVYVHRLSWELEHQEPVPAGHHVLHHCDNPPCLRPAHLFTGTDLDNVRDMWAKGRAKIPSVRGSQCGQAKLTEASVAAILSRLAVGEEGRTIAKGYGVSEYAVSLIKRGKTWKHVPRYSRGET